MPLFPASPMRAIQTVIYTSQFFENYKHSQKKTIDTHLNLFEDYKHSLNLFGNYKHSLSADLKDKAERIIGLEPTFHDNFPGTYNGY